MTVLRQTIWCHHTVVISVTVTGMGPKKRSRTDPSVSLRRSTRLRQASSTMTTRHLQSVSGENNEQAAGETNESVIDTDDGSAVPGPSTSTPLNRPIQPPHKVIRLISSSSSSDF